MEGHAQRGYNALDNGEVREISVSKEELFGVTVSYLSGSVNWKIWSGLCSLVGLLSIAGFVTVIKVDLPIKFLFIVIFFLLLVSVIWLSVMTRDKKKRELLLEHGHDIDELRNVALSIGNVQIRFVVSLVLGVLSVIFFVIGMSVIEMDGITRLVGCSSAVLILTVVFQQAKTFHDPIDAEMLISINQNKGHVQEHADKVVKALLNIGLELLKGSAYWRVWTYLCTAIGLAEVLGFVLLLETTDEGKLVFALLYLLFSSSVIWLSLMTRDSKKQLLFSQIYELKAQATAMGNMGMRLGVAWLFALVSLVMFGVALKFVEMAAITRLVGFSSAVIVLTVVFQQTKTFQDMADAEMLRRFSRSNQAGFAQV